MEDMVILQRTFGYNEIAKNPNYRGFIKNRGTLIPALKPWQAVKPVMDGFGKGGCPSLCPGSYGEN